MPHSCARGSRPSRGSGTRAGRACSTPIPASSRRASTWPACRGARGPLEPRYKELIHVAVAGAATHLYEPGLRAHIRRALEVGASREEIAETLELASTLGIHAVNLGVPMMVERFAAAGQPIESGELDERRQELKATFERERGYWHEFWNDLLALSPAFFEAYLNFSAHPWRHGVLPPKLKEFVYIAFDAAATHMFAPGLQLHIDNAIGYGATPGELMEVFEIATALGMHGAVTGMPILDEEIARRQDETAG